MTHQRERLHALSAHGRKPAEPRAPRAGREPLWRQALGEQLRRVRHDRGETLSETAARAGVSMQYLSEIERGVKEPSSEMVAAVAGALGITLLDLTIAVADQLLAAQSGLHAAPGSSRSQAPASLQGYLLAA